jgi:SAM-dependent methyltransferase
MQVSPSISGNDEMLGPGGPDHYFRVGGSALENIKAARLVVGAVGPPRRILDLPCGHGRVQRWLRAEWPSAHIVAVEIDHDAVDFCVGAFEAEGVYSTNPLTAVDVGNDFDLIFCGSLLTHFDAERWSEVLSYFRDRLAPGGVAVVTTHGELSAALIEGEPKAVKAFVLVPANYGLTQSDADAVLDAYRRDGFGYADYPQCRTPGYGISVASPEWVRRRLKEVGVQEVFFAPQGWDNHQDVWGFVR